MQIVMILLQFFIAFSIFNVWVLRYRTIASDFQQFGLPVWLRNVVGAIKVFLSVLLVAGIWKHEFTMFAATGICVLMIGAVIVHIKEGDSFSKLWPALALAILSLLVAVLAGMLQLEVKDAMF